MTSKDFKDLLTGLFWLLLMAVAGFSVAILVRAIVGG